MRLRNRPLLVDGIDADLYVPRAGLERKLLTAIRDERNTLLVGPSGSGKTTLLRKLASDVRGERPIAWVDGGLANSGVELLALVARALPADRSPRSAGRPIEDAPDSVRLIEAVDAVPRETPALIVLDDLVDERAAYDVFGRLRDRVWMLPHVWVAAARPPQTGAFKAPPADAFWEHTLDVPEMDRDEISELLARALSEEEMQTLRARVPEWPLASTPRSVVRWAQDAFDGSRRKHPTEGPDRTRDLPRAAVMALAELEGIGRPAAASDPELLARLGWSRPYVARWLAHLEGAGYVRSFAGPTAGQGRPPKLYEAI